MMISILGLCLQEKRLRSHRHTLSDDRTIAMKTMMRVKIAPFDQDEVVWFGVVGCVPFVGSVETSSAREAGRQWTRKVDACHRHVHDSS
jgi:hypothetical protein